MKRQSDFGVLSGFIEYRRVGPDTFKMRSHRRIELSRRLSGATVEGSNK